MRKIWIAALAFASCGVFAQTWVDGHTRRDGTYVPGHYRSAPNDSKTDNYGSKGNTNPYTGERGTVDPYRYETPKPPVCGYNSAGRYVCR
jgi:hypothetical protein